MQFYYLGKGYNSKKPEGETFKAYKHKDKETGLATYYPVIPSLCGDCENVFINGVGWKKVGKNGVDVPVFDMESGHWDEYCEKYGKYCLYYSIDGTDYDSHDCCSLRRENEFNSIMKYGVEGFVKFMDAFMQLHGIQLRAMKERYLPLIGDCPRFKENDKIKEFLFSPCYDLGYSFLVCRYSPDILMDDRKMENLYKEYRTAELTRKSEKYRLYEEMEKKKFELLDQLREEYGNSFQYCDCEETREYYRLDSECHKLYMESTKEIRETVWHEMETASRGGVFPIAMPERVEFLFGTKAAELYNYLADNFLAC